MGTHESMMAREHTVTFRTDEETKERLSALAAHTRRSRSSLIQFAVEDYLSQAEQQAAFDQETARRLEAIEAGAMPTYSSHELRSQLRQRIDARFRSGGLAQK